MRIKNVEILLEKMFANRLPVLLTGAPGVGKTDIVKTVAGKLGMDVIVSHPVVSDPTDAKGLPWVKQVDGKMPTEATFLPFGDLSRAIHATRPTLWFLDDLGQAPPAVQASFMQLLLSRRVNGHALPDCVAFGAATNGRSDRAGVSGILEPVKSRFTTIVQVEADVDDWASWAMSEEGIAAGVRESDVAFLRFRPELLHDFKPSADLTNSPSPRTWVSAAKIMGMGLPSDVQMSAVYGAVGEGAGRERLEFEKGYISEKVIQDVIDNPQTVKYPSAISELYSIVTALAYRAKQENIDNIIDFAIRLRDDGRMEYSVRLLVDLVRGRHAEWFTKSPALARLLDDPQFLKILSDN